MLGNCSSSKLNDTPPQEEEQGSYEVLIQGHTQSEQDLKRSYEEQLKQAEDDVV